jgi:CheY-like chemotaxis protein
MSAKNILVVDDEPTVLRGTCRALRMLGLRSWGAGSVAAALELAAEIGAIDAVVSDYDLGDGTGLDLYEKLYAPGIHPYTIARRCFILYTANYQAHVPGVVHIHKPNIAELQARLKEWF